MRVRKNKKTWTPMVRCSVSHRATGDAAKLLDAALQKDLSHPGAEVWGNGDYTAFVRRYQPTNGEGSPLVHLSIHDGVRSSRHDWRDLQRIKNDILGPEQEAFELYPAESRLVDTSNEWHLWCIDGQKIGVGFQERLVSEGGFALGGAKQRPWPENDKPEGLRDITQEEVERYAKT